LEVKYQQQISERDARSLHSFMQKDANRDPFGVLVTLNDEIDLEDPDIVALPLSSLLLMR